ncbi:hypothetical protein TVAG_433650 [Trichomonas vaginalis G3]|uniref:Uncharacterized protein n=1 Tax=Trichomonas vaginalis (strain ATCC PRA-98 / G3) TaxID=412133 RepID=A2F7R0_TRIV3|nr:MULE transposase domain-containing protein [Trichomonas vaginalis G3]EAX99037.1 hypothetical protein TVAG_433650 [Trichomonas vaginalis G3]KAI5553808.1 MULE transposase domain-containing protein [Trichomonas vaginalis G3]|eukprot:XP_001311967.1 hypothetical protein [Trichomonas vaginalis G3]
MSCNHPHSDAHPIWNESRFLMNSEIISFINIAIQPNLPQYLKRFGIKNDYTMYENIPFFVSRKLDSRVNVVVVQAYQDLKEYEAGYVFTYLKVSNVKMYEKMFKIFSTNEYLNCIQNYNIKIVKQYAKQYREANFNQRYLYDTIDCLFSKEKQKEIHPGDTVFYVFTELDLKTEFFEYLGIYTKLSPKRELIRGMTVVSIHIKCTAALRASLPIICEFDTLQNR